VQVRFLRYIRQWGKKVLFVVNKVDTLRSDEEIAEVAGFVGDSARKMLGVDAATVLPVSARLALAAKLDAGSEARGGLLASADVASDSRWLASKFSALESYMLEFLTGGTGVPGGGGEGGRESTRLKLETPIFVSEALMQAARQQLDVELLASKREVRLRHSVVCTVASREIFRWIAFVRDASAVRENLC
jgi:hypothetical protein